MIENLSEKDLKSPSITKEADISAPSI